MIDNKKYPEIYFSSPVRSILDMTPHIPRAPIEPKKPTMPIEPDSSNWVGLGCFPVAEIGIIVAFIYAMTSNGFDFVLLFGLLFFVLVFFFSLIAVFEKRKSDIQKKLQYEEDEKKYPGLLEQYKKSYREYLIQKDIYDAQVKKVMSQNNLTRYRQKMSMIWLEVREKPRFMLCDDYEVIKKGRSEKYFMDVLSKRYEVLGNQKVPVGTKYYYPDIIVVCDNLYIDIEIDEPYVDSDGSPIHYLEGLFSIDSKRNDYMINQGWEVIRFSEEQIFLYTQECIQVIENFINAIKEGKGQFEIPPNMVIPKWTKEQAFKLAYQRYRNTYVPKELVPHKWVEEASQKLSLEDIACIAYAVIKQSTYGKSLVFIMKTGKPRIIKWSTQAPDYVPGTKIAPSSVEITKIIDSETGFVSFVASGEALG